MAVDICADDESDDVKEWHPRLLWQESLRKGQSQRRGDPADLHDRHEASPDGRADLVESPGARDYGHRRKIDRVLNGGDLRCSGSVSVF